MYGSKTTVVVTCYNYYMYKVIYMHACIRHLDHQLIQKYKLTEDDTFILELNIDILNY